MFFSSIGLNPLDALNAASDVSDVAIVVATTDIVSLDFFFVLVDTEAEEEDAVVVTVVLEAFLLSSLLLSREADRVRELERDRLFLLVVVDLPRDRPRPVVVVPLLFSVTFSFITSFASVIKNLTLNKKVG